MLEIISTKLKINYGLILLIIIGYCLKETKKKRQKKKRK